MGSPATEEMRQRVLYYLNNIKNGSRDCLNQRFFYELVDCSFEEQWMTLRYHTEDWMLNPGGVVHGGIICTIFDISMGTTSLALGGIYNPTVNLSVNFLSPMPNHERILLHCSCDRLGKTLSHLTARAVIETSGAVCATASAVFYRGGGERLEISPEGEIAVRRPL